MRPHGSAPAASRIPPCHTGRHDIGLVGVPPVCRAAPRPCTPRPVGAHYAPRRLVAVGVATIQYAVLYGMAEPRGESVIRGIFVGSAGLRGASPGIRSGRLVLYGVALSSVLDIVPRRSGIVPRAVDAGRTPSSARGMWIGRTMTIQSTSSGTGLWFMTVPSGTPSGPWPRSRAGQPYGVWGRGGRPPRRTPLVLWPPRY